MRRSVMQPLATLVALLALIGAACSSDEEPAAEPGDGSVAGESEVAGDGDAADPAAETAGTPAPSPGCGAELAVEAGESTVDLQSGGLDRWFVQYVPAAHDGVEPVPLVLDLHGYMEGASIHTAMSDMRALGEQEGFAVVTPQGTGEIAYWNAARVEDLPDDVEFIAAVLDDVGQRLCIDENRVYVTGLSNGAMMTSLLICDLSDRIAAAAPVAGVAAIPECDPERPVPTVAFHGTEDQFVTFDGSLGEGAMTLPVNEDTERLAALAEAIKPIPEAVATIAERNGCGPDFEETQVSEHVRLRAFAGCPEGAEVLLYIVEGGGHAWPGSEVNGLIESITGPTTFEIDANEVMWEFFEAHPLS